MIVGTKIIPIEKLRRECRSADALRAFSLSLVPRYAQHLTQIVDNQRYLVAMEVRAITSIPYSKRVELCESLLDEVQLRGTINTIIDLEDVLSSINVSALFKVLFEEEIKIAENFREDSNGV